VQVAGPLWQHLTYRIEEGHLVLRSAKGGTLILRDYINSLHNTRCPVALSLPANATKARTRWQWARGK
jgi:hypothetical protein